MPKSKAVSYEELKTELDAALSELQGSDLDVDEALKQYEQGLELVKQLEAYLEQAENKVKVLKATFGDAAE